MRLSRRIILILLSVIIVYFGLIYWIQKQYILPTYLKLEKIAAIKDIDRCSDTIYSEINYLSMLNHDWAAWDDTYNFLKTHDKQYIDTNLQINTFINNKLNLIFIYDTSRKLIWGNYFDYKKKLPGNVEYFDNILNVNSIENILFKRASLNTNRSGIILTELGPLLLAVNPILTSKGTGPCLGTFIMGRLLTKEYISTIGKRILVDFTIVSVSTINNNSHLKNIVNKISPKKPYYFSISNNNHLQIYSMLNDFYGKPALLIQIKIPRKTYVNGQTTLTYSLYAIVIIGIILLIIMITIIQRTIIRPISKLTKHTAEIKKTHNFTCEIYKERKDEIGILSREFDNMLTEIKRINDNLESRILLRTKEILETRKDSIFRLANAAEERDTDTGQHLKRIKAITTLLAQKSGIEKNTSEMIGLASTLHDIGKIGIQDEILFKNGKLDKNEYETIKKHSTIGGKILANSNSELIQTAWKIALYHHERWSGNGYPSGLSGEKIPLAARITAIADVFDALASKRVYKNSWTTEEIKLYFEKNQDEQFDPILTKIFLKDFSDFVEIRDQFEGII